MHIDENINWKENKNYAIDTNNTNVDNTNINSINDTNENENKNDIDINTDTDNIEEAVQGVIIRILEEHGYKNSDLLDILQRIYNTYKAQHVRRWEINNEDYFYMLKDSIWYNFEHKIHYINDTDTDKNANNTDKSVNNINTNVDTQQSNIKSSIKSVSATEAKSRINTDRGDKDVFTRILNRSKEAIGKGLCTLEYFGSRYPGLTQMFEGNNIISYIYLPYILQELEEVIDEWKKDKKIYIASIYMDEGVEIRLGDKDMPIIIYEDGESPTKYCKDCVAHVTSILDSNGRKQTIPKKNYAYCILHGPVDEYEQKQIYINILIDWKDNVKKAMEYHKDLELVIKA